MLMEPGALPHNMDELAMLRATRVFIVGRANRKSTVRYSFIDAWTIYLHGVLHTRRYIGAWDGWHLNPLGFQTLIVPECSRAGAGDKWHQCDKVNGL